METVYTSPDAIEKEVIGKLIFPLDEVLDSVEKQKKRMHDAEQGMLLGNNHKGKVSISFKDAESVKMVQTTIWGVTDSSIILKSGMSIPLRRVINIEI
jgi:hypothetical protein